MFIAALAALALVGWISGATAQEMPETTGAKHAGANRATVEPAAERYRTGGDMRAWIETETKDDKLSVMAYAWQANEPVRNVEYFMESERRGTSGNSLSRQEGAKSLPESRRILLSQSTVNVAAGDALTVTLQISSQGKLFATDTLHIRF